MGTAASDRQPRSLTQVIIWAGAQAVYVGAWVAAGELPAARRRLVRAGIVAGAYALIPTGPGSDKVSSEPPAPTAAPAESPSGVEATTVEPELGSATNESIADPSPSFRSGLDRSARPVVVAVSGVLLIVGRRQLKKRWLAGLSRAGYPHPHVALAARMSVAAFVISLVDHAIKTYDGTR